MPLPGPADLDPDLHTEAGRELNAAAEDGTLSIDGKKRIRRPSPRHHAWYEGRSSYVEAALNLATIIVAIVLMVTILLQSKTSAFGGGMGGDSGSIVKTRRGFEQTLFQFTIGTAVVFVVLCVLSGLML